VGIFWGKNVNNNLETKALCVQMEVTLTVACEILLEGLEGGAHWEQQRVR